MLVTKLAPIDLHVYTEYIQNANIDRSWHFNPNCRRFWFLYSKIELKCTTKTGTIRKGCKTYPTTVSTTRVMEIL